MMYLARRLFSPLPQPVNWLLKPGEYILFDPPSGLPPVLQSTKANNSGISTGIFESETGGA
eukprot:COSAG05_NODE_774_length_7437_cov_53.159853_2_plen_61_part_00